jgi:hypothetical protein
VVPVWEVNVGFESHIENIYLENGYYTSAGTSVVDPDLVGSGPFWSDPDPDVWDRIRILNK